MKTLETEFKNTYEKVSEIKEVKIVFNFISRGFSENHKSGKGFTEYSEIGETILEFVRDCSTTFVSDISTKSLKYGNPTVKQSWCVSFEFIKIQHMYESWVENQIKNLNK